MKTNVVRLDSRRDGEAVEWAKELRETEAWFQSARFRQITRLHTPYEVVALRGSAREDYTVAKQGAAKMHDYLQRLFKEKKQEITYGPFSPTGAVRAVMEGIQVLYLGGWATSARGSDSEDPGADLANYALDRVPKEGASWVRALLHQDEAQRSNRMRMSSAQRKKTPPVEFSPPMIIPDGDTGHGGEHHIRNLVKKFVESKIGAVHLEDQRPGCKVCGHQGQKVLVSTAEKSTETPTSVLERWLRMWAEHWSARGVYNKGDLSVEVKERWAGSEEMMLNVFDEARDKIAEITYRADKDREGRKFLAVKDQNTVKPYRSRRLMTLMHFFLLHRYKTDLVHYVTPTGDNRLSVRRMIQNGVFRETRTDDPNVIAIEVNTARAQKIFANDETVKRFIARPYGAPDSSIPKTHAKAAVA